MPLLLDLFCGAGGCSVGYSRAGFDVVGVDIVAQPHYPFQFHQADALEFLARYGREFDAIHASPPCQGYSKLKYIRRFTTAKAMPPLLIEPCLKLLEKCGKPYVLENVPGANLDTHAILCGSMFGLGAFCSGEFHQLRRHREFQSNVYFLMPLRCRHVGRPIGVYGKGKSSLINGFVGKAAERREAMGISWMNRRELSQAIPPAYTEWIGRQLMNHLNESK